MQIREKLVRLATAAARKRIREHGGNNRGAAVHRFLAEVGLPEGYAWCDAFVSYELHTAAGKRVPIESASVWQTYSLARELGWLVTRPLRGDLVLFDFDRDGRTDDHIGVVVRVLSIRIPGCWLLRTVEGNTSSGAKGSQADGGGVYVRRRLVRKAAVRFIRVPGEAPKRRRRKAAA